MYAYTVYNNENNDYEMNIFIIFLFSNNWQASSLVNIAVAGQYFSNFSPNFISFIEKFPNWAHITAATSFYRSYTFNV